VRDDKVAHSLLLTTPDHRKYSRNHLISSS
jgi:hypothetical protein